MTDKITIDRALLQQALETLEGCYITFHEDDGIAEAINVIRAALAAPQPAQEPVGFMSPKQVPIIKDPEDQSGHYVPIRKTAAGLFTLALYTTPQAPQRQPLSGIQKAAIGRKHFGNPIPQEWYAAASDLEAAHGITKGPAA